jgi:hypothetical protein
MSGRASFLLLIIAFPDQPCLNAILAARPVRSREWFSDPSPENCETAQRPFASALGKLPSPPAPSAETLMIRTKLIRGSFQRFNNHRNHLVFCGEGIHA